MIKDVLGGIGLITAILMVWVIILYVIMFIHEFIDSKKYEYNINIDLINRRQQNVIALIANIGGRKTEVAHNLQAIILLTVGFVGKLNQ